MAAKTDYEKLGKVLEDVIGAEFRSTPRLIWRHFVGGIFAGLGGVIGATVMVALLLGILSLFVDLPGIGQYFRGVQETIQDSKPNK